MEEKNRIRGRKSRSAGIRFERRVRKDLESKGLIVIKNPNNVIKLDTPNGQHIKFTQGKSKYNPYTKRLMMNSGGFPDFIAFKNYKQINPKEIEIIIPHSHEVIGVECKTNGYLSKEEKEKCRWLLDKKIFSKILIAKKKKEGRKIAVEYIEFKDKYDK